jgi:hypothetical protein
LLSSRPNVIKIFRKQEALASLDAPDEDWPRCASYSLRIVYSALTWHRPRDLSFDQSASFLWTTFSRLFGSDISP